MHARARHYRALFCCAQNLRAGTAARPSAFGIGECVREGERERGDMAVLLVPVLWAGGALVLLGGGYYLIAHLAY
jgi:hypothetical protein